jgi:hypothetical protein
LPNVRFFISNYVLETYIIPDSKFIPTLWAGHPKDEPRTTNGVEAFHRHFNQQFYTPYPHIHQVISVILKIQSETELKITSINKNINNYRRKESIESVEHRIN